MGPKPLAGEDQTGFSPDDRKNTLILTHTVTKLLILNHYSSKPIVPVPICFAEVKLYSSSRAIIIFNTKHTHTHTYTHTNLYLLRQPLKWCQVGRLGLLDNLDNFDHPGLVKLCGEAGQVLTSCSPKLYLFQRSRAVR